MFLVTIFFSCLILLNLKSARLKMEFSKIRLVRSWHNQLFYVPQWTSEGVYLIVVHGQIHSSLARTLRSDWQCLNVQKVKIEFVSLALCGLFSDVHCLRSRVQRHSQNEFWTENTLRNSRSWENPKSQLFLENGCSTNPIQMESFYGKTEWR